MQLLQSWTIDKTLDAFFIPVRVQNPITQKTLSKWCLFDTGFTGYLGLDKLSLEELGLEQIGTGMAITIGGKVSFSTYSAIAEIMKDASTPLKQILLDGDEKEQTIPVQELKIPMVGIKTINKFDWLIVAERKMLCMVEL